MPYINPPDMTKEAFLADHGRFIKLEEVRNWDFNSGDELPVCLVDNGMFTAAGICPDAHERDAFTYEPDPRPKRWYAVKKELLKPYMEEK